MNRRWGMIVKQGSTPGGATGPRKGGRPRHGGAKLAAALKLGLVLSQLPRDAVEEFLAVPASSDIEVAQQMAALMARLGIQTLTPEQRNALSLKISKGTLKLASVITRALLRASAGEEAASVKGADLAEAQAKLKALGGNLSRSVAQAEELVGDGKRLLEAWQYEAQWVTVEQLFKDLSDTTLPEAERRQLLVDAGGVLDTIEEVLQEARDAKQNAIKKLGPVDGQLVDAQKELELLQTMHDLRDHKLLPHAQLEEMAQFYAEYTSAHGDAAPGGHGATHGPGKSKAKGKTAPARTNQRGRGR